MLPTGCPIVYGFRRREYREEHNDDGEKTESELPREYHSRIPPVGTCSGCTQIADVHMKDSIGQAAEIEKPVTAADKLDLSDPQHHTKAEPMFGSCSYNISSTILGFERVRVHTERDSKLLELESKLLEEVHIGAPGLPESTKGLTDCEEFEEEVAEFKKILDQLPGDSGLVPRNCLCGFRKRKPEGDERESSEFPNQDYDGITKVNRSPILGFSRRAQDRPETEYLESEPDNGQGKTGIFVAASSAVVNSREKQLRRETDEGSPNPTDIKAISLPGELVERILAMIPFPQVLKTRVLNKSWKTNFSASPGALVFQNQVRAVSGKWKHYCPIILNIEEEWLVGYDREYNRWQNMSLRFETEVLSNWFSTQKLRGAGSLMCGVFNRGSVFVTNLMTRTRKWLPSRPNMAYPTEIHLIPMGSEAYQVLLITKDGREPTQVSCQIYDSRMESWTVRRSTVRATLSSSSSVHLNGVLYVMEYDPDDFHDVMKLLLYNVSDGTWTNIHHPFGSMLHEIETYELLVCQNHVMVVLHVHPTWWTTNLSHNTLRNTLMVYKLDPESLDIREVARGPPEPMSATCSLFASDNDCIYFGDPQVASSSVVQLNLQNREWRCLPPPACADGSYRNKWATFSFQPGMNPFVSV